MPAADPFTVTVVGIGEDGWEGLRGPARAALAAADVVLGGPRQLDLVAGRVRASEAWPRDLVSAVARLPRTHAGRRVAVLASGDPMHFGIGTTLVRELGADRVRVLPAPSSVSLACARLGWPVQDVAVLSAVGRPYAAIVPELRPGARVLVLTGDADGAARVGRLVAGCGLGGELTVLERLGGPQERIGIHPINVPPDGGDPDGGDLSARDLSARDPVEAADAGGDAIGGPLAELRHDRLTIVAVRCGDAAPPSGARPRRDGSTTSSSRSSSTSRTTTIGRTPAGAGQFSRVPGLADEAYVTDGVLTKREVRAVTMAALAPIPGELLWDVGAGSGSVTTEWLRTDRRCRAIAIEPRAERRAFIRTNARRLAGAVEASVDRGVAVSTAGPLRVVEGLAPESLAGLPAPDAVFIGGGAAAPGVIEACLAALPAGGRLVANAVTVETEAVLAGWHGRLGGELRRIEISRAEPVGSYTAFRPARPVTQWVHTVGAKR